MKKLVAMVIVVIGLSFIASAEYQIPNHDVYSVLGGTIGMIFAESEAKNESVENAAAEYDPETDCYIQRLAYWDTSTLVFAYSAIKDTINRDYYSGLSIESKDKYDVLGCESEIYLQSESENSVKKYLNASKRFGSIKESAAAGQLSAETARLYIKTVKNLWGISS